jgi:Tol biopolymer transport system component
MQHWLPYEEERLYRLLLVDRGTIWRQLRDDTRTLADLAHEQNWDPRQLAHALIVPWRAQISDERRLAMLEHRALRTLTQGHLAQHLFFHSLHQNAIPDNAPAIFGVASREEFAAMRRSEFSPLQICRLNGLSRGHAQRNAVATLTAMAERGVRTRQMPESQARLLLSRQLHQLPRWLQQTRYNGPPPIVRPRPSAATASNYSTNASLALNGRRIVFETYDAKLATIKTRGEINVVARRRGRRGLVPAGPSNSRSPQSSYNAVVSANGRWVAFESAAGNLNFGKRYGQISILVRDLATGAVYPVSHQRSLSDSRSAYNPTISSDGRFVAFEAYEQPERSHAHAGLFVLDRRTGEEHRVAPPRGLPAAQLYEPSLSMSGRVLTFTALDPDTNRSRVFVRALPDGPVIRVSAQHEEAWEPALARDGTVVAYTAMATGGRSRVVVRDLVSGVASIVPAPAPGGLAYEPSLSANGRWVAFSARPGGDRRTQVYVRDRLTGDTELVSRGSGNGPPGVGASSHPSLSGDGRLVAFTSDSWNLSARQCNTARGVFVRDLRRRTTRLVSVGDGNNRYIGPTKGSSTGADAFVGLLCG